MSRRITRSQTIYLANPPKLTKPVINSRTSTSNKSKTKPQKRKAPDSSFVEQAPVNQDASITSLPIPSPPITSPPKIWVVPIERLLKSFEASEPPVVDRAPLDTPTSSHSHTIPRILNTSEPVAKVKLQRPNIVSIESAPGFKESVQKSVADRPLQVVSVTPKYIDSGFNNKPISSRRKTISSEIPKIPSIPTRRSERILKKTMSPIATKAQPKKNSANQKPQAVVHSIPNDIPIINDNLPSRSTTKIAKRRKTTSNAEISKKHIEDSISHFKSLKSTVNGNERQIEIVIPHKLRMLLNTDSNVINRQQKCYRIPATYTVAKIIKDYVALKQFAVKDKGHNGLTFTQAFQNIIEYFDALGFKLLYQSECIHYLEVMNTFPGEKMSNLYTPIYLLRLFNQWDSLIQFSNGDKGLSQCIVYHVNNFLKYLTENMSVFVDLYNFC